MLELRTTSQFKKDYKRCKKRGLNMALLHNVINELLNQNELDPRYRDHALTGTYLGFRECHVKQIDY